MKKEYTIKEIQKCIFSIVKDLDFFCRENDIEYYLMGGSALGAMRHKGFIPWDDDFDVFMTVPNYKKFLLKFENATQTDPRFRKYFLQKENTNEWPLFLSRICLNGTTVISDEFMFNMKQHHTLFVDIMCLYSAPENAIMRRLQYTASQLLRVNALALCGFPTKNLIKRILLSVSKVLVNPVSRPYLIRYVHKYEGQDTKFVGHYFGRARYRKTTFLRRYLGKKPRYVQFEDIQLPVFENVEEYLVARFGNKWMEMPSQDIKDRFNNHGNYVDLENDYTKYMSDDGKKWLL